MQWDSSVICELDPYYVMTDSNSLDFRRADFALSVPCEETGNDLLVSLGKGRAIALRRDLRL